MLVGEKLLLLLRQWPMVPCCYFSYDDFKSVMNHAIARDEKPVPIAYQNTVENLF